MKGDCSLLRLTLLEQLNNYPKQSLDSLMNVLSTHDSTRIITLLGRRNTITDKDLMADEFLDEWEYQRGKEREKLATVLQFFLYGVPSVYYGDEEGLEGDLDPYNRRCFNWEKGAKDLTEHYKKIAKIRKSNAAFKNGVMNIVKSESGLFVFTRGEGEEKTTIALNAGRHSKQVCFSSAVKELYTNAICNEFELKPNGFLIISAKA
jgi:glycosidase